jgi:hypothetical protein
MEEEDLVLMEQVASSDGKVVDLNQGNESYLYYRSLYSKKLSTLYQVTLQSYMFVDYFTKTNIMEAVFIFYVNNSQ